MYNLNVRGKRGNILQVYPAIGYDFVPKRLQLRAQSDLLHFQWTGSNTHNNGAPGGDGQTGDVSQAQTGTDQSNLVQIIGANENYPFAYEQTTLWKDVEPIGYLDNAVVMSNRTAAAYLKTYSTTSKAMALYFASGSFYSCFSRATCGVKSYEAKMNASL